MHTTLRLPSSEPPRCLPSGPYELKMQGDVIDDCTAAQEEHVRSRLCGSGLHGTPPFPFWQYR